MSQLNAIENPAPYRAADVRPSWASRVGALVYGTICYVIFLGVFLNAVGFVMGFGVPVALDTLPGRPLVPSFIINLGLLSLFAVQHSGMARPTFKRWWTKTVPVHLERSTYVLFSNVAMILLFDFWQPMGGPIWHVEGPLRTVLFAGGAFGWALLLYSTFALDHFDLFGMRQVWTYFRGRAYKPLELRNPWIYRVVRHPLYVGWLIAFWVTPTMTVAHLVFAVITTLYILVAIQFEERNLIDEHGDSYRDYRRRVPMLIPFTKRPRRAHPVQSR